MACEITQRGLRNDSGQIMRELDRGESFVVTRGGIPVGELVPLRRHRFISAEVAVTAITMAELSAGPHAATTADERARRQDRLQPAEAAFDPLTLTEKLLARTVASTHGHRIGPQGSRTSRRRPAHRRHRRIERSSAVHPQPG